MVTFCRSGDDERLGRKVFLLRDGFRNDAFVEEEVSLLRRHLLGPKRLVVDRESRDRGPEKVEVTVILSPPRNAHLSPFKASSKVFSMDEISV